MFNIPNSPKDLGQWLLKHGLTKNVSDALVANQVGGETFAKFTRADLMDLFPDNFLIRKKLWDLLEDMRHQEEEKFQKDVASSMLDCSASAMLDSDLIYEETQQSSERSYSKRSSPSTVSSIIGRQKRKGSSSMSTLSVSSDVSEKWRSNEISDQVDDDSGEPVPKLKRAHAFCEQKPDISNDESEFNKKFVFPISKEVNSANKANQQLPEKVRNRFLRECLTCLQAVVADENGNITPHEFEMGAKKICNCLPILKDVRPPGWPIKKEFPFWSTVKCQLRQRLHNTNYLQRKSETTTKKQHNYAAEDAHDDTEIHHQEMLRELKKKSVNYKAIKELQQLSFEKRRNAIEDFSGKDVVKSVLEKYPFYKNEFVLLNELELHVARSTRVQTAADTEVFKGNFLKLQPYILAAYDDNSVVPADVAEDDDIHPGEILEAIQKISQLKQPFLLFIPEDVVDLEYFIRNANISTAPVLTALETDETTQLSITIDKEIKLSLKTKDYITECVGSFKASIVTGSRVLRNTLVPLPSFGGSSVSTHGRIIYNKLYISSLAKNASSTRVFHRILCTASSTVPKPVEKQQGLIKKTIPAVEEEDEVWRQQKVDFKSLPSYYMRLAKIRLTGMVVLTAMAGYALAPEPMHLGTFMWMSLGTLLCSSSANAINQWLEIPFDSQMARTQNRVLVKGFLSPSHVLAFGIVTGAIGVTTLLTQVNGLTALLGGANLLLYTCIYTPLKRLSIINTWMGSLVGGIPPLMGWAACTGSLGPGALVLAGILYSWQFPHFNALSWNLRPDYSRAGYRMMCVTNPALCRRVALRHSIYLIGLSTLLPLCDVTSWWLALDSLPLNVYLTWLAWRFYQQSDSKSSRELFRFSLLHLPVLMLLIMFHKKPKKNSRNVVDAKDVAIET